jgi:primosomal protein N' (replication factor Y)
MTERQTLFADVILPIPVHREFTYRVPFEFNEFMKNGIRVIVPFGKSKLLTGIVPRVHDQIPVDYQAKYIEHVLDENPIVTGEQYSFWKWIASYYMAPLGDVMNAALPANFKLASETKIVLHPDFSVQNSVLNDKQQRIIETLEIREVLDLKEISELLGIKTIQPVIKEMIDKKMVLSQEELQHRFTPKTKYFILLTETYSEETNLNGLIAQLEGKAAKQKQLDALLQLLSLGKYTNGQLEPVEKKQLIEGGVSLSALNTLEKNGIVQIERFEVGRLNSKVDGLSEFKPLAEQQQLALNELHNSMATNTVTLLHGVTGSGKTEIYVQLIQEQLDMGKQVLFLLPEIALTTQLIQRLSAYFGEQIGVYHSKFNQNERVEIWNTVLKNDPAKFRIILGARSSIFLPYRDLGLIIVDEEHESSFKQYDPSPRYNARDAAIVLAHLHSAKVILGSSSIHLA